MGVAIPDSDEERDTDGGSGVGGDDEMRKKSRATAAILVRTRGPLSSWTAAVFMPTVKHFFRRQYGHQLRLALSTKHAPMPAMQVKRAPRRTDRLKKHEQPSQQ